MPHISGVTSGVANVLRGSTTVSGIVGRGVDATGVAATEAAAADATGS